MSEQPLKHSRLIAASPIYYGWVVLLAGSLGMLMTIPGQTVGVSVFLDKIILDLDISRSLVSFLYLLGTVSGSFFLPGFGRFIDRSGPRKAVILIASLFALACVYMGLVANIVMLALGFIAIRSLGQGALALVSLNVINLWFVRRRGFALSISGIGLALGIGVFPLIIESLINQLGWRLAYASLGGVVALTILPLGALFYREQPERYGLQPDGHHQAGEAVALSEVNYTLPAARRTLTFWIFTAGSICVAMLITGLLFHHYSIMANSGIERSVAAMVFVPFGVITALANLITGVLLDRISPRFLMATMLLLMGSALFLAVRITTGEGMLLYGGLLGLIEGMNGVLKSGIYAYYFGRSHLGSITGFATTLAVIGTATGPVSFALGFEHFGSYGPVLALTALPPVLVALALLLTPSQLLETAP
ncbi:MAG: MFS transporter [Phormidium sp. GEM2.Bin31]|nr:MFS transporter [Phormidium sp. BM_Day4_Bin.17]TVR15791.1 MAG: MFS transporter [Phormidium sp. GEM2.Bin31]UCJ10674.1 MAG: MFS transporter [Phormidium sp. PBR-2020]